MSEKRCSYHPDLEPKLEVNEPGSYHYGKLVCPKCARYIAHAKKPSTIAQNNNRKDLIVSVLMKSDLEVSEVHTLCQYYSIPHLNLIQDKKFNSILMKYMEIKPGPQ